MGDVNRAKSVSYQGIVGAEKNGAEFDPIKSYNDNRELAVADVIDGDGAEGAKTINDTAQLASVGGSALTGRKCLTLFNNSQTNSVYWGRTSSVTAASGTPIFPQQHAGWRFTANADIYLVCDTGESADVRLTESAGDGS